MPMMRAMTFMAHPIYFLETFVDPERFRGTCYRAANWIFLGKTTGRGKQSNSYVPNAARYPSGSTGCGHRPRLRPLFKATLLILEILLRETDGDASQKLRNPGPFQAG